MPFPALECSTCVYRAIQCDDHIKSASIHWRAFVVKQNDTEGVSVSLTQENCGDDLPIAPVGIASVHVGRTRDVDVEGLTLDIEQDTDTHANITGLPYPYIDGAKDTELWGLMTKGCREIARLAARKFDPATGAA